MDEFGFRPGGLNELDPVRIIDVDFSNYHCVNVVESLRLIHSIEKNDT